MSTRVQRNKRIRCGIGGIRCETCGGGEYSGCNTGKGRGSPLLIGGAAITAELEIHCSLQPSEPRQAQLEMILQPSGDAADF
jgi:hypothetical protein